MGNLVQAIVGIVVLLVVVGGLLYIFYSKTNAVEKTGFGSLIMLALVALMIPVFWIVEGGNQVSATMDQQNLAIERGMHTYAQVCTDQCFAIDNDKVKDVTYNGYTMDYFKTVTDNELRRIISGGVFNPKAVHQPVNANAIPRAEEYGGGLLSNDIDYLMALIRSSDPKNHEKNGFDELPAYLQANNTTLYNAAVTFGKQGQFGEAKDMTSQKEITIDIADNGSNGVTCQSQQGCFTPINIKVKVGTKITWVNKSKLAHTVVAAAGQDIASPKPASDIFDSKKQLATNDTFTYTVTDAAYNANSDTHRLLYYCSIHPDMVAQLVIEK